MISSRCTKTRHMAIRCNQQLATFAVGIFFWAKLGRSNEYNLAFSRGLWLNSLGQDRALRGEIKGSEPVVTSLNLGIFASWYIVEAWHQTQKWYKDIRRSIIMMIMYLYHFFFWFILPGLPDFFHQKHFNMCTVKSCRFIEKESAASRCTFASTRHPHGTCHIRGWGCPGPPFQCCTLGVKTPQQEFSRGPFCFTVAIDLILNLHLLLLLGWGSHKEIILIYLITFLFVLCVQRGGMW